MEPCSRRNENEGSFARDWAEGNLASQWAPGYVPRPATVFGPSLHVCVCVCVCVYNVYTHACIHAYSHPQIHRPGRRQHPAAALSAAARVDASFLGHCQPQHFTFCKGSQDPRRRRSASV
jgi:hypothetical protein